MDGVRAGWAALAVRHEPLRGRPVRSWVFDAAVAVAIMLVALPFGVGVGAGVGVPVALVVTELLAQGGLAMLRRAWPLPVFVLGLALLSMLGWYRSIIAWSPLLIVALYTVASRCARVATIVCAVALATAAFVWSSRVYGATRDWVSVGVLFTAIIAATVGFGLYIATRRALLIQMQERAARLEAERDHEVELATVRERSRIAREMHDVLAHHLTVMTTLADGAAAASAPGEVRDVMSTVSATGRQALSDTRGLLGVLREDGAPRSPLPGLGDIGELVGGARAAGLPVRLMLDDNLPALEPAAGLAIFRLVQEALTNTMKHAGDGVSAAVSVRREPGEVVVEVADDGYGCATGGVGRGLTGMRERIAAVGGQVSAGPRAPRGWSVSARVPAP